MTPPGHLACSPCRLRLRADSPAITVLEGRCPICGATLSAAASASDVVGFRSFDLSALLPRDPDQQPTQPVDRGHFLARRRAAPTQDTQDAERWADDGGRIDGLRGATLGASVTADGGAWPTPTAAIALMASPRIEDRAP